MTLVPITWSSNNNKRNTQLDPRHDAQLHQAVESPDETTSTTVTVTENNTAAIQYNKIMIYDSNTQQTETTAFYYINKKKISKFTQ